VSFTLAPATGSSVRVDNRAVDAPGNWRIGRLCARGGLRRLGMSGARRQAGQTALAEPGTWGPRKNRGKFRREISCRGRFFWKSQLLILQPSRGLPASFSPFGTAPGKGHDGRVEIFWRTARLSEYSAMGPGTGGMHRRNLGLPGEGTMKTSRMFLWEWGCFISDKRDLRPAYPAAVNSGESLVKEMHGRYAASWYPAVTFTQKSTTYNPRRNDEIGNVVRGGVAAGKASHRHRPAPKGPATATCWWTEMFLCSREGS